VVPASRWLPAYAAIARILRLNPLADLAAALALGIAALPRTMREDELRARVCCRTAVIVGAGPSLDAWADRIARGWPPIPHSLIAADDAAAALLERGVVPDVLVTDLDGDPGTVLRAARMGSAVVVLAHGDNVARALWAARALRRLLPTGQVIPLPNSAVHGGFTDGDRAAYLAAAMGAGRAVLVGMDLEGEVGRYSMKGKGGERWLARKRLKLRIARALLDSLAESGFELLQPEALDQGAGDERRRQPEGGPSDDVEGVVRLDQHAAHGYGRGQREEEPPADPPEVEGQREGPRSVARGVGVAVHEERLVEGAGGLHGAAYREGDLEDAVDDLGQQQGSQQRDRQPPAPEVHVRRVGEDGRPHHLDAAHQPEGVERRPVGGRGRDGGAQPGGELLGQPQRERGRVERGRRAQAAAPPHAGARRPTVISVSRAIVLSRSPARTSPGPPGSPAGRRPV